MINKIAVIGAGTMGAGIAQISAASGYPTILYDIETKAIDKGKQMIISNLEAGVLKNKISSVEKDNTLKNLTFTTEFNSLKADFIIEAIIEKLDIKQELFNKLSFLNTSDSIFASNTSSIPITRLASGIPNPERICGMHFFNPAHIMKLVEIVSGASTSERCIHTVVELAKKFGKTPVLAKDAPGFIVNRIGKLYHTEPIKILEEHIASIETIDMLLESSGFKMGPFKLIDLIGVDANLNVTKSIYDLMFQEPQFKPSRTQQQMVDAGFYGKKSGRGFYKYV